MVEIDTRYQLITETLKRKAT